MCCPPTPRPPPTHLDRCRPATRPRAGPGRRCAPPLAAGSRSLVDRSSALSRRRDRLPAFVDSHRPRLDAMLANPPQAERRQRGLAAHRPGQAGVAHPVGAARRSAIWRASRTRCAARANVLDLKQTIADTDQALDDRARARPSASNCSESSRTLGERQEGAGRTDGVKRTLVALDTSADARASIVIGDLSTAHYVSCLVPGMYMSVGEQIVDWAKTAQEPLRPADRLAAPRARAARNARHARASRPSPGSATRRPCSRTSADSTSPPRAPTASSAPSKGLQALRKADPPYLSVFAHSYGSTAALLALRTAHRLGRRPGADGIAGQRRAVGRAAAACAAATSSSARRRWTRSCTAPSSAATRARGYGAQQMGVDGGSRPDHPARRSPVRPVTTSTSPPARESHAEPRADRHRPGATSCMGGASRPASGTPTVQNCRTLRRRPRGDGRIMGGDDAG